VDFPVPRKSERVAIQRPVTVKFNRDGNFEFTGISRDLSDSGIFFYTESVIQEEAEVELTSGVTQIRPCRVTSKPAMLEA
jgi:hypothetical protein